MQIAKKRIFFNQKSMTELQYIQSTGTQWIDTGIRCTNGMHVKMHFKSDSQTPAMWSCFFTGLNHADSNNRNYVSYGQESGFSWGISNHFGNYSGYNNNYEYTIEFNSFSGTNCYLKVNNSTKFSSTYTYTQSDEYVINVMILGNNDDTHSKLFLYDVILYSYDGSIIRNYIPMKDGNGRPGLFDSVTKKMFYSSGTEDFIAGPPPT